MKKLKLLYNLLLRERRSPIAVKNEIYRLTLDIVDEIRRRNPSKESRIEVKGMIERGDSLSFPKVLRWTHNFAEEFMTDLTERKLDAIYEARYDTAMFTREEFRDFETFLAEMDQMLVAEINEKIRLILDQVQEMLAIDTFSEMANPEQILKQILIIPADGDKEYIN
jgi:hypothetical protein